MHYLVYLEAYVVVVLLYDTIQSVTACHELYNLIYQKQVPR